MPREGGRHANFMTPVNPRHSQQQHVGPPPPNGHMVNSFHARSNLQPRRLIVTVPRGVRPGTKFVVVALGERHIVTCPPGVSPGMKVQIFV